MNLLSFLIGTGINLIYTPFSDNARSDNNAIQDSREDGGIFPFNILKNTPACTTMNIIIRDNALKVSTIPRGYCSNCCSVKISRDVRFFLYNKQHRKKGVQIEPFDQAGSAKKAGVNPDWNTIIYVHGFSEPSPGESGRTILDAYISRPENYNVILLDWGELCTFPWYRTAAQNVKLVGQILKNFIELFNESGEIPIQKLHVIGFSLGSHIASMAGKGLQGQTRIPRITALDPAYPEFSLKDRTKRLVNTDADYIDVIHTDAGILGFPDAIGHADFYPNGGRALQPGCQPSYLARQRVIDQVLGCSHVRAWKLYAESVRNPEAFPSTQCETWKGPEKRCNFTVDAYMGFASNKENVGQFYLPTGFKSPYSMDANKNNF